MNDARVADLRAALSAHRTADPRESWSRRRILGLLDWLVAPFDEHADPTHVTAGAIVVDPEGQVLLHRHKRLGVWLQPGGHVDGDETPAQAALRETREETGIDDPVAVTVEPVLVHIDVHEGPRGHVHLDLRYLVATEGTPVPAPGDGESEAVAWFTASEAMRRGDGSVAAAVRAALEAVGG